MCEVKKKGLSWFSIKPKNNWQKNEGFVDECLENGIVALHDLKQANEFSLLSLEPALFDFLLPVFSSEEIVYSIFILEPILIAFNKLTTKTLPVEYSTG